MALGINMVAAHRRLVHRPGARRRAGRVELALDLLGERADRHRRHRLGLPRRCTRPASASTARIDWWGNVTFAVGLTALLAGITYGIQPYGGHTMGWTNPWVLTGLIGGVALLVAFCVIETQVAEPMFPLGLFRNRAFAGGNAAAPARLDRPRRPAVHADHLAAGHLAAAARLRLRATPRCGPASTCCR